jgi:hypothetical protein
MPHVRVSRKAIVVVGVAAVVASVLTHASIVAVIVAALAFALIMKVGLTMLGGLSRLPPEPPPPGELRKVKNTYRCSVCGAELRMTLANDEVPAPPRHCQEDMDLVATIDDML